MPDDFNYPTLPGLLLATDLSARCDRPLERAKQLAGEFNVPLDVLTVAEAPQVPGEVLEWLDGDAGQDREQHAARTELAREFDGAGLQVHPRFAGGQVDDAILETAAALPGYLVVTGTSRKETLGHLILGSTVERLARNLAQPLLVVRRRVRGPYRSVLVATDCTPAARLALRTAARMFPDRRIVAYHAHAHAGLDARDEGATAQARVEQFIDECGLAPGARANVMAVVAGGKLEALLTRYVRDNDIDLAVLGLQAEPALKKLLMGSRSEHLLQDFICDTLLVPAGAQHGDG